MNQEQFNDFAFSAKKITKDIERTFEVLNEIATSNGLFFCSNKTDFEFWTPQEKLIDSAYKYPEEMIPAGQVIVYRIFNPCNNAEYGCYFDRDKAWEVQTENNASFELFGVQQ